MNVVCCTLNSRMRIGYRKILTKKKKKRFHIDFCTRFFFYFFSWIIIMADRRRVGLSSCNAVACRPTFSTSPIYEGPWNPPLNPSLSLTFTLCLYILFPPISTFDHFIIPFSANLFSSTYFHWTCYLNLLFYKKKKKIRKMNR